jgi:Fe2+ transport system protein B
MNIVPTAIEEQVNRIDRQKSRVIGISSAVVAAWCAYRLIWLVYLMATFGGFVGGSLVFSFVLWGVIGVVAATSAVAFLLRARRP